MQLQPVGLPPGIDYVSERWCMDFDGPCDQIQRICDAWNSGCSQRDSVDWGVSTMALVVMAMSSSRFPWIRKGKGI